MSKTQSTAVAGEHGRLFHRSSDEGRAYWGPGDLYRFLVTGAESGGAYFAMEAVVPPGGGPPPHIHTREDETFYVLDGEMDFLLGDEWVSAGPGDFVNVPRGTVHCFRNSGDTVTRMVLTFSPAGLERFFEETLDEADSDRIEDLPDNVQEVAARFLEAAPRHGLEFIA